MTVPKRETLEVEAICLGAGCEWWADEMKAAETHCQETGHCVEIIETTRRCLEKPPKVDGE